jgi:thymidine kinase
MSCGYLELIVGPMFSGKTTRLIEIYNKYNRTNKNVVAINYSKDTRYHNTMLSTHDKVMIPCIFSEKLFELDDNEDVKNSDVILINEGQFFEDIFEYTCKLVEKYNKRVYICGLDGDFERNKFGKLLDLIPLCDNITKLRSNCSNCNSEALFSHRVSNEKQQVVVGVDNYVPLCRCCYLLKNTI